jgi:hypothetical protein
LEAVTDGEIMRQAEIQEHKKNEELLGKQSPDWTVAAEVPAARRFCVVTGWRCPQLRLLRLQPQIVAGEKDVNASQLMLHITKMVSLQSTPFVSVTLRRDFAEPP